MKSKAAVIVEPRLHFAVPYVIDNVTKVLPDWPIYFFCGDGLFDHWRSRLPMHIYIVELQVNNLTPQEYNDMFKSATFWEQVPAEKILVFQTDAILCHNSPHRIEDFLHYDYVGGYTPFYQWWSAQLPWIKRSHYQCFNGGLSLRSKSAMLHCLREYPPLPSRNYDKDPSDDFRAYAEDMYFVNAMHALGYNVGTDEFATHFCTHGVFRTETFGAHNFYRFVDRELFFRYCPEGKFICGLAASPSTE